MNKDAYYFPHFCNARHDRKIKRLRKELGIEGYAIYFMLLEILREQVDFSYPLSDVDLLSEEIGTSEQKINVVIGNYKLFELDKNQHFFSPKLIEYLQPWLNMKEQRKLAGMKSAEARRKKMEERLLNGSSTDVTTVAQQIKESKRKENKEKIKYCDTVFLTHEEYEKLSTQFGKNVVDKKIERLDYYQTEKKHYKDHYKTLLNWLKADKEKEDAQPRISAVPKGVTLI